eukprot:CAMPEP_0197003152 /NCGR_PEP_ID=MMETSP1380-20130617/7505_1 /TAXON_ID=5936 /ORGANISM="Euplotes crassus, Strain CT5" /LENGTH=545 /DNA_ID=CAMNT_0042421575 /DNA_START=235 /DNA_END=1869 /DNA_ORIENTATION=-
MTNNPPDSAENVSLRTENDTNLDNLEKVIELSSKSLSLMKKLKSLKKKYDKRVKLQKEKKYQATSKALEKIDEESKSELAREEMKEEIDKEDEEFERMNFKEMATENSLLNQQIMILSGQLAPIMDRVGRMYTDFSPHLLHSVNNYNGNINSSNANNRDRNTHENAERSRTHHPRRRERLRSEDSEESSDDDFSRRDSDESDNEDRDNTQQEEQQRDRREDSHEIRNRLRSISSTISRIRSSISSMRSLIFNNVEEDDESNNNESRNEEREERNVAVNAQIPVISSPGDIASVHSRLNRFINGLTIDQGSLDRMLDRQAMNGMETEGFISSLANRNNPGQNSNGSRNPRDDSGNNPTENRQENPSQNNGERINREGQRRNQNTEINHNHDHIHDHHHHTSPNLFDLLGPAGNGRGGLGILGNNLGGLGDASDTIEFHIHAFMPNSNGPSPLAPRQPNVPLPRPENHLPPFAPQIPPLQAQMPPPELQAPPIGEPQRPELVDASTSADPPQMRSTSVQTEGIRIRRDRRERNRENGTTFNKNPFSR